MSLLRHLSFGFLFSDIAPPEGVRHSSFVIRILPPPRPSRSVWTAVYSIALKTKQPRITFGFWPSFVIRHSSFVIVLLALLASVPLSHASSQQIYLQSLTNFETYAETIWHDAT